MESPVKPTILVVDDEIGALTLIGIMLERGGYQVLKAKDAKSALEILDRVTPCLITTDIMMPGMDGFELCQIIRKRPATQHTPIIIMSARGDADSVMRGYEVGANNYLPLPILHHDLVKIVTAMLAEHGIVQDVPVSEQDMLYLGIGQWNFRPLVVILPALIDQPKEAWESILLETIQNGTPKDCGRAVIVAARWKEATFKTSPAQQQGWKDIFSTFSGEMAGAEKAGVRFSAFALALMKPPEEVVEGLLGLVGHSDAVYRRFVLQALMAEQVANIAELAVQALKDNDSQVRVTAVNIIAELGIPEHIPLLVELFKQDDSATQRAAGHALGKVGGELVEDVLASALFDERKHMPGLTVDILNKFPMPRLTDALLSALDHYHDNNYLVTRIMRALAQLPDERIRVRLQKFADHPENYVKYTAQSALKSFGEQHGH